MPSSELPRHRGRDELLRHIYREGARRRASRRTVALTGLAVAVLLVAGSAAAFQRGGDEREQQVASVGTARTTAPTPTTPPTTTAEPVTVAGTRPSTKGRLSPSTTATTKARGTATTSSPACRNSDDPACGAFRWDPPPPPNQPLQIAASPTVDGRTLSLRVATSDADADVRSGCWSVDFGDGTDPVARSCAVVACLMVYGPWTPPAPQPSEEEHFNTHTYANPGKYTVTLRASTAQRCHDPYSSSGEKTLDVVVG